MANAVKFLDINTARLITSNQVIQGPYNVVKELVENALDAGATAIDIKLENYGLEKITVKDNATGIKLTDVSVMCKPGYSSKITNFSDLETLKSYGFRGEALASICCIAEVSITTKTEDDAVATCYKFDSGGEIVDKSVSHLNQGTLVCVQNIFHHQPARRRILMNAKASSNTQGFSKCGTLAKIRSFLGAVGVAWPFVRIFLVHGGSLVWKKQGVSVANEPIKTAFGETLGHNLVSSMRVLRLKMDDVGEMAAVIPAPDASISELTSSNKASIILIINKRVVRHKKIEDVVMEKFRAHFPDLGRSKYPACVLDFKLQPEDLDVNLEPDKSKFLLRREKEDALLEFLKSALDDFYQNADEGVRGDEETEPPAAKKLKTTETPEVASQSEQQDEKLDGAEINKEVPIPAISQDSGVCEPIETEASKPEEPFKIEFFSSTSLNNIEAPLILDGLNIEIMQKNREEIATGMEVCLSEASSDDESQPILPISSCENSILCTPENEVQDDDDFVFNEEDEAALMELEKLMGSSQTDSTSSSTPEMIPVVSEEVSPKVNYSDWSRGHILDENGSTVEGCEVLVLPKANVRHEKKVEDNYKQKLALLASPCTQMGLHNLRAFNMFCRHTRPKLLKESPDLGLCEVAPRLARLWKELPDEEKEHFDTLAQQHKMAKLENNSLLQKSPSVPLKKTAKKDDESAPSENLCMSMLKSAAKKKMNSDIPQTKVPVLIEILVPDGVEKAAVPAVEVVHKGAPDAADPQIISLSKIIKKKRVVKTVEIDISLEKIMKNRAIRHQTAPDLVEKLRLLGNWNGSWLVRNGADYSLLLSSLMHEALEFKELMSNSVLSTSTVEEPIPLNKEQYFRDLCRTSNAIAETQEDFRSLLEKFTRNFGLDAACPHGRKIRTDIHHSITKSSQPSQ